MLILINNKKGLAMKTYGYLRVSTDLQNCANQRFEIENIAKNKDFWLGYNMVPKHLS